MTDYNAYRSHVGISNPEMTRVLHRSYRGFGRPASSFINNPDKSGLCLLPEAEAFLVSTFGPGPGLASLTFTPESAEPEPEPPKKRPENRRKKNRISFRLDETELEKAEDLREAYGAMTWQELFEKLLRDAHRRWEEDDL